MDNSITTYNAQDLPAIISEQVKALAKFGRTVEECVTAAKKAKESSNEALKHHVRWFGLTGKQEAIEYLQKSAIEMTKSQVESAEALKSAFEYQQKMAAVAQYLVNLGLAGIKNNRETVKALESKLRFASLRGINSVAKHEIELIVKDLKSQRDIQCKIDEQILKVSELQEKVQITITTIKKQQAKNFLNSQYYNIVIALLVVIGFGVSIYFSWGI